MSGWPRPGQVIRAMAAAVLLATAGVGCADDPVMWPADPTPESRPDPSVVPVDPAEAEAIDEILTLIHAYREVEVTIHADPQPPHLARDQLAPYLADPLLTRTLGNLDQMHRNGVVFHGRPAGEPAVVELRLDDTPPTARIHECRDLTDWRSVVAETGDRIRSELPDRYLERLDAKLYPAEGWLLHEAHIAIEEDAC